jgi:hypothetical protein
MKAVDVLEAARSAGIALAVDGNDLVIEAAAPPPSALLDALSHHKPQILVLLSGGQDGWSAADWQEFYDERAGIAEFDGRLPRPEAESLAFACCVVEWLNRNPVRSLPGQCVKCGRHEGPYDPVLPYGTESSGHAWLHSRCWPNWHEERKAKATRILAVLGIAPADPKHTERG